MTQLILGIIIGALIGWNVPMPPWAKFLWILILERIGRDTDVK